MFRSLAVATIMMAPLSAMAEGRFEGWRMGVHTGAAFAETDYSFRDRGAVVGTISNASDTGPLIGVSGGYDHAMGDWTLGLGVAIERAVVDEASTLAVPGGQVTTDTNFMWMARVGPRVGYASGDMLVYAEGGIAAAYIDQTITSPVGTIDDASGHLGWTAGVGAEIAITENLSATADLRMTDLSAFTYDAGRFSARTGGIVRTATVGLTWRW